LFRSHGIYDVKEEREKKHCRIPKNVEKHLFY